MRKQCVRILIALIGVAGLGMAARGQVLDQIQVNIPYEFVVAGKTLPAGTYRVSRLSDNDEETLVLSSVESRARVMVPSTTVESTQADKPEVSFEQVGGQHFLSKIETANHVFTIPVSRSEILEAAARSHSATSTSGRSDGKDYSSIPHGAACGPPLCVRGNRRKRDRLLRKPMRLLPIVNRVRAKMGTGEDLRSHAQWP